MIDGLSQIGFDLDKLFSFPGETVNRLATSNEDLVLGHLHHNGADLPAQGRRFPFVLNLAFFEVEYLKNSSIITSEFHVLNSNMEHVGNG